MSKWIKNCTCHIITATQPKITTKFTDTIDGSLVFVQSTEDGRVIFEMFDPDLPDKKFTHALSENDGRHINSTRCRGVLEWQ